MEGNVDESLIQEAVLYDFQASVSERTFFHINILFLVLFEKLFFWA